MGFFDNIGKAISDAGNTAIQKGKDAANTAKYNRMIADEEKELEKLFEQLGRKFFEQKGADAGEEYAQIIGTIDESLGKINEYRDMVKELQGVIQCAGCGADIPSGASFCPECGEKVPVPEPEAPKETDPMQIYCTECGAKIAPGIKFCMNCGTKVELAEVIEPETAEAAPEVTDPEETAPEEPAAEEEKPDVISESLDQIAAKAKEAVEGAAKIADEAAGKAKAAIKKAAEDIAEKLDD